MKKIVYFLGFTSCLLASQDMPLKIAIDQSNKSTSFVYVDEILTQHELDLFESLHIQDAEFSHIGTLTGLKEKISHFFISSNENNRAVAEQTSALINQMVQKVVHNLKAEAAWVVIRTSKPNNEFKTPRWHIDGYYYKSYTGNPLPKFVITLRGPSTLFYKADVSEQKMVTENIDRREYIANQLHQEKVTTPNTGQGVFFVVGNPAQAAVHSEPHIDADRIFLAIVAGSNQQINELKSTIFDQRSFTFLHQFMKIFNNWFGIIFNKD